MGSRWYFPLHPHDLHKINQPDPSIPALSKGINKYPEIFIRHKNIATINERPELLVPDLPLPIEIDN